jgi:hypothetical protein
MIKSNGSVTVTSPGGWIRSSQCAPNANCVEVFLDDETVGVRDSKIVNTGNLIFVRRQWTDFLGMIAA